MEDFPAYPEPGQPIKAEWGHDVIDWLKSNVLREGPDYGVERSGEGCTLKFQESLRRRNLGPAVISPWTLIPRRNPSNDAQILVRVYPAYFKGPVADAFDFEPTLSATSIWDDEYPEATLSVAGYHYFYALAETDENGDLEGVTIASYLQGTDTFPVDIIPDPWTPDDGLYAVEIGIVRVTITTGVASAERYRQYLDNHIQFRAAPNGFGLLLPTV